jgi:hypothetical protein
MNNFIVEDRSPMLKFDESKNCLNQRLPLES